MRKDDEGKLNYSLLPFESIEEIIKVLQFGADKYGANNWKSVPNAKVRYLNAAFRHLVSYTKGQKKDKESGLPTLAHLACNILFLLYFEKKKKGEKNEVKF